MIGSRGHLHAAIWAAAFIALVVMFIGAGEAERARARVAMPTFVLVGGGLEADGRAVLDALLVREDTHKIVIVPYASGEPERAARNARGLFQPLRPRANFVVLPDPALGDAQRDEAAAIIGHADLVFFTGGDQSRLTERFLTKDGRQGPVLRALHQGMLDHATVVGGTSAGAAVMADTMFTGGGSEKALLGEDGGVKLGPGFGLVGGVVIDTHTLSRGRYGRMVAALESTGHRFAIGLCENRGVIARGGVFTAIGDGAAVVIDGAEMKRDGLSRRGARASILGDGDVLNPRPQAGVHVPVAGSAALGTDAPRVDRAPEAATLAADAPAELKAWDKDALLTMARRLAGEPTKTQTARSDRFVITLRADERTRWHMHPGKPETLRVFDVILDIDERKP